MASELNREVFKDAKAIWLTPLIKRDDVFETMLMLKGKNKGLCFMGDSDQHFSVERYEQLVNNINITSRLIPNANHSSIQGIAVPYKVTYPCGIPMFCLISPALTSESESFMPSGEKIFCFK